MWDNIDRIVFPMQDVTDNVKLRIIDSSIFPIEIKMSIEGDIIKLNCLTDLSGILLVYVRNVCESIPKGC